MELLRLEEESNEEGDRAREKMERRWIIQYQRDTTSFKTADGGSAREVLDCDGGVTRSGLTTRWRVRVMASGWRGGAARVRQWRVASMIGAASFNGVVGAEMAPDPTPTRVGVLSGLVKRSSMAI
ncbi:hypothetical protein DY000_02045385 [Brassica cretica]|uniref:Uncharacterized protein n=1 Tax=Brassica cretica TaxID=69181 RepID=A0ABQ7EQ19_BRACR|nr:hypothetical protein DY000_02045385 [Brassica cretica]